MVRLHAIRLGRSGFGGGSECPPGGPPTAVFEQQELGRRLVAKCQFQHEQTIARSDGMA
jgi:hypothetical protein